MAAQAFNGPDGNRKAAGKRRKRSKPDEREVDIQLLQNELAMFHGILEGMSRDLPYIDLLKLLVESVTQGLGFDRAGIFLVDEHKKTIGRVVGIDDKGSFEIGPDKEDPIKDEEGFSIYSDLVHGYRKFFYSSHVRRRLPAANHIVEGVTCNANVPIRVGGAVIGVLAVDNLFTQRQLTRTDISSLLKFATQAGFALESIRLHERIRVLSVTDELTGTFNRRLFTRCLEDEISRSRRYKHTFSLLYFDVDRFKRINDRYGHPVGDQVLKYVADHLKNNVRSVDTVSRIGGEEFAVILPEIPPNDAMVVAKRLVRTLGTTVPAISALRRDRRHVTMSAGIAGYVPSRDDASSMIRNADASLYRAKHTGRNRVGPLRRR
jgi:diguanylate cyclase (GGDEF)-like protein